MTIKVIKEYIDKETKKRIMISKDGSTIEVTPERGAEIIAAGYAEDASPAYSNRRQSKEE